MYQYIRSVVEHISSTLSISRYVIRLSYKWCYLYIMINILMFISIAKGTNFVIKQRKLFGHFLFLSDNEFIFAYLYFSVCWIAHFLAWNSYNMRLCYLFYTVKGFPFIIEKYIFIVTVFKNINYEWIKKKRTEKSELHQNNDSKNTIYIKKEPEVIITLMYSGNENTDKKWETTKYR